jgi:HAD superfamily hydrolase (TIGR01459 family)
MTRLIDNISQIADQFDAIILDQWGVLHDGTTPYPGAVGALIELVNNGVRLGVLSNSGKRTDLNIERIASKGFNPDLFECVMTSGEALWQDAKQGKLRGTRAYVVSARPMDAAQWAVGLEVSFAKNLLEADHVLIMGLPEGDAAPNQAELNTLRDDIIKHDIPVYCSNPDRTSPRASGALAVSPGALAHAIKDAGGNVAFYGKPHAPVFHAIEQMMDLEPSRLLMVGDSLEHDIGGAAKAGWQTLFVRGGIDASAFDCNDIDIALRALLAKQSAVTPDFSIQTLR